MNWSLPLKMLPAFIHNIILVTTLNRMFKDEIKQGELDFLQGKIINILTSCSKVVLDIIPMEVLDRHIACLKIYQNN